MKESISRTKVGERVTPVPNAHGSNLSLGARFWRLCKANRYLLTSLLLLIVMLLQLPYGKWTGDFWEHAAVVREFATNPFNPQHPLLLVDVAHPFFSPYLLLVGLFARLLGLNAITALAVAGIGNLLFLLFSLRLFIQRLFTEKQAAIAFYALLFILFMWPSQAWSWSGFLHFKVLGYVLPYPSTFAIAATFLIFAVYFRALAHMGVGRLLFVAVLGAVVLITHPTTAVVMFIGLGAISMHHWALHGVKAFLMGGIMLLAIVLLAFVWPYYSFFDLLQANSPDFHTDSFDLYGRFYIIWPTLLLLPFALSLLHARFRQNRFDALLLMLVTAVVVFILGYLSGQYGYGRVISFIAIIIQICAAAKVVQLADAKSRYRYLRYVPAAVIALLILVALNSPNQAAWGRAMKGLQGVRYDYSDYQAISHAVGQYDVVLSDIESSWMIPAFGGKVVASKHPAHWVDDHAQRRQDLANFFIEDASLSQRSAIIDKYQPDFILVALDQVDDLELFYEFGEKLFLSEAYLLLRVDDG